MSKQKPVAKPGGVTRGPMPAGQVKKVIEQRKNMSASTPRVAPKKTPAPMPTVKPKPGPEPKPKPQTSVPAKSVGVPPGAALRYEKEYQAWAKKHPKQASAWKKGRTV